MLASLSKVLEFLLPLFQGGATSILASSSSSSSAAATPPPSPSPSNSGSLDPDDSSSGDSSSAGALSTRDFGKAGGSSSSSFLHVARDLLARQQGGQGDYSDDLSGNAQAVDVTVLALKCLTHLFSWVPLNTVISSRLLASVFHFAGLGIPVVVNQVQTDVRQS